MLEVWHVSMWTSNASMWTIYYIELEGKLDLEKKLKMNRNLFIFLVKTPTRIQAGELLLIHPKNIWDCRYNTMESQVGY